MEVENTQIQKDSLVVKGYEFLRQLCSFKADYSSFNKRPHPNTNRVDYINAQLDRHGIPYTNDYFIPTLGTPDAEPDKIIVDGFSTCFVNVIVEIEGTNKEQTTVFLAHHDVNNKHSENCQDNTASVANLLDLCVRLSKDKPANNVVIAFVDAEEIVRPDVCGSRRLGNNILAGKYGNVKYAVNLELTANGRNYWMSFENESLLTETIEEKHPNTAKVMTPYNDAWVLELTGVPSACIGSLDNFNIASVRAKGFCKTWAMCHRLEDTFDSQANEADMDLFMEYLLTLI